MKKRFIVIVVLVILAVIITVIVADFLNNRPDRRGKNPYALEMDEYKSVDPELVHYRETKNIPLTERDPGALDIFGDTLYIAGDGFLQVITTGGKQLFLKDLPGKAEAIKVTDQYIFIAFADHLSVLDQAGEPVSTWESPGERTVITSLGIKGGSLYVADAGNRRVIIYDLNGNITGEFEGKATSEAGHGFIVPSPSFDLVINGYGELWVVNPGKHSLENYTDEGEMRGYWQNSAMTIEGFTGCCNPAEITVMEDGSFVTSEKGLVRIKVYDESGKLKSVVAPPDKFKEEGDAPEVVVDGNGMIYALDFDRKVIRIFELKEK